MAWWCDKHKLQSLDNYCFRCMEETRADTVRIAKLEMLMRKIGVSYGQAYALSFRINEIWKQGRL